MDEDFYELLKAVEDVMVTIGYRSCLDDAYHDATMERLDAVLEGMGATERIDARILAERCKRDRDFARYMVTIRPTAKCS
ncbi:hypothetical protein AA12717_0411 [Gluconacetobacter sacchari DSM 12717]|uniref:Uncharacterized protein n=2 Tax=Gluconacetobacter sacchari TaxID=92759 RepID=A0A7W4IC09_9PROT|nr:hypothetical protein [Gluconacetobacter sacchari]MBB2160073.1 hypothetical protein [Gluconacetobacter sacchari]GBQ19953.1 hypothetical protein AA12717_0411 [Gluconacetobacter sacchari DSM 12717]